MQVSKLHVVLVLRSFTIFNSTGHLPQHSGLDLMYQLESALLWLKRS